MNKMELSDVTVQYLDRYYEILEQMKKEIAQSDVTDSVSRLFMAQALAFSKAASENAANLLRFTTYIPLQYLSHEMIDCHKSLTEKLCEIKDRCPDDTSKQKRLYLKSFDTLYSLMLQKASSSFEDNDININFIRQMTVHHRAVARLCRSARRFGVCEALHPTIDTLMSETLTRLNKLEYLYHCIR